MLVEGRSKPTVAVVTAEFTGLAARMAARLDHPSLPTLVLPFPLEGRPDEEVRSIAHDAYPRLVRLLGVRDRAAHE
ncbi:MAG: hypothetical protein JOZ99_01420 [Actinobacteria bacterium]|nr:hypothetical protein [Actinomycetota bacterium]